MYIQEVMYIYIYIYIICLWPIAYCRYVAACCKICCDEAPKFEIGSPLQVCSDFCQTLPQLCITRRIDPRSFHGRATRLRCLQRRGRRSRPERLSCRHRHGGCPQRNLGKHFMEGYCGMAESHHG